MNLTFGRLASFAILCLIFTWGYWLSFQDNGRNLSFSLLAGCAFGIAMQRGRFCFLCNFRDFVEERRSDGVISILVALLAGVVFYQIVIMAWVPQPQPDRLPPNAHIGPVGGVLAFSSAIFGFGAALSGSCLSGHFYRLGEGAFGSIAAILGAGVGFLLGFASWNTLYTTSVFDDPPVWLPHYLGYVPTLLLAISVLAALAALVLHLDRSRTETAAPVSAKRLEAALSAIFVMRWPPVATGLLVATISAFAYFRVAPLGVTAELGSIVRTTASVGGLIPSTMMGLDTVRGCISAIKTTLLSANGVFVISLVVASFASALAARQFKPSLPSAKQLLLRFIGGVLMGWGGMTALGCTVGVLLSGIHAGALSGWVFLLFCAFGAYVGLRIKPR